MSDIAARSGVSRSTVSFVLNGRTNGVRIPEETRQRVLEIATEMGYRRNELARAMVTGKNRVLGFMTQEPKYDAEFAARILGGAIEEATEWEYGIKVLDLASQTVPREAIERCIQWRLAGVLALGLYPTSLTELHTQVKEHDIETVVVEGFQPYPGVINVSSDNAHGIALAVDHLMELGHRRIGMLAAARESAVGQWRVQNFQQLSQQRGLALPAGYIDYGDWHDSAANEAATRRLLSLRPRPTALICAGDPGAMVALRTARSLGLQLPRDLSVVGHGDYSLSSFSDPSLTTIAQPFREVGRASVRRLLERIENTTKADTVAYAGVIQHDSVFLPSSLVVRGSTAPVA